VSGWVKAATSAFAPLPQYTAVSLWLPFKVVVFRGQLGKPWQAAEKLFALGKWRQNDPRNHTNMGQIEGPSSCLFRVNSWISLVFSNLLGLPSVLRQSRQENPGR
jgi:hypothetical protein